MGHRPGHLANNVRGSLYELSATAELMRQNKVQNAIGGYWIKAPRPVAGHRGWTDLDLYGVGGRTVYEMKTTANALNGEALVVKLLRLEQLGTETLTLVSGDPGILRAAKRAILEFYKGDASAAKPLTDMLRLEVLDVIF